MNPSIIFRASVNIVIIALVASCQLDERFSKSSERADKSDDSLLIQAPNIWSEFGVSEPVDQPVVFWGQKERDAGFRKLDNREHGKATARLIKAGGLVRELPKGKPLNIEAEISEFVRDTNHAGFIVLQNGEIRYENYGLKLRPDERWTSFSVAKAFTSTLVGAAEKDGYIKSLHDKVTDYIPNLAGSVYDDVTIEQLITMSSGVSWSEDYSDPQSNVVQSTLHVPDSGMSQTVSYMRSLKRAHPPGEVWNYSTGETNLVGVLVSNATGKTLSDYLSEKIWTPYGMEANATWLVGNHDYEISGCCIQARVRDFARYGQFILEGAKINGGSIVKDDWLERATKPRFNVPRATGINYGYQWLIYPDGSFGHFGIFGQAIIVDPSRSLVIASNASWVDAAGNATEQFAAREAIFAKIKSSLDAEE